MPYWYNRTLNRIKTVIAPRRLRISEARCRLYHIKRMLVARRHYKSPAEPSRLVSRISGLGSAWLHVLAWHRERLKEIIIYIIDGLRGRDEEPVLLWSIYVHARVRFLQNYVTLMHAGFFRLIGRVSSQDQTHPTSNPGAVAREFAKILFIFDLWPATQVFK